MNLKNNNLKHDLRQVKCLIDNEQVLNNMLDGFIIVETDGKIVKVNPAYCKMIGYTEVELLKMNVYDLDTVISSGQTKSPMDNIINMETARFETKHKHKDGHLIDLDISIVVTQSGKAPIIAAFIHDITTLKQAKETADRFSRLFEESLNEIYIIDAITYKFIEVNRAALNNIQYSFEEMKDLTPLDIKPAHNLDSFNELIKPLRENKTKKVKFKTYHKRKNGTLYPVEVHYQLIDFGGQNAFAAIILDITDRQKTENALFTSYENYRELINGMNETVWVIGFDGKFIDVNRSAVEKLGYTKEELLTMRPVEIDSTLDVDTIKNLIKNISKNKLHVFETIHTTKNGKQIPVEIQSTLVIYQNEKAILNIARDISDRKLIEKKLIKERQLFDVFMDNTADNIYFKDKNSNFIKVNKHLAQYLNVESPEQLIGKSDFDFFDEKHANAALKDEKKILKTGVPILDKTEKEIFKDGTTGWVSTSKLPISDLHGNIIGTFGISRDITDRIKSEEEIRRLSEIVEQTESPVILTDLNGTIQYVNPAFEKVTGYKKKDVIGQNPRILKSELMPNEYYKRLWKTILNGKQFSEVVINKKKNKEIWYYDQTIIPLKDEKGRITQFVSTGKDISDKILAEQALKKSEKRLSLAIKAAKLGIWEWDIKNKKLIWDKIMFSLYGISNKDFDGTYNSWTRRIHPDDLEKTETEFNTALNTKKDLDTEFRVLLHDGTIRHIQGLGVLQLSENDEPDRIIGVNWDITEQKQAEDSSRKFSKELEKRVQKRTSELEKARIAALSLMQDADLQRERAEAALKDLAESQESLKIAKETAEAATKAKSNFLASMSHELRTPLNSIIGFSQVLREQYFGKLNEKQAEYVVDIMESGEHLLDLINDILDLSKIEAGKMELELDTIPILRLLENSLSMIKEKCTKKGIQLSLETEPKFKNLTITADQRKVKQVMFNLLSNAAKFTPSGGIIKIVGLLEDENVMIKVTDTGIGIHKKMIDKIFEEFFQVSSKIVDKTPGTGLGLPLSKRMIYMHGGKLWAESEGEGKGSTFIFTLPIEQ